MTEVRLINLTPHPIKVLDADGTLLLEIPPSGRLLRFREEVTDAGQVLGVPVVTKRLVVDFADLPEHQLGTFYIVPLVVAQAVKRADFLVPDDLVRDNQGRVIGCRRFSVIA